MKLLSQHGYGAGDKAIRALRSGYIDGAIYSPRDISADRLQDELNAMATIKPDAELLFDPQYYAAYSVVGPESRLGHLATSKEEYTTYFRRRSRRELESDTGILNKDIADSLRFQAGLSLTGLIGPNILITRSFDSIEGGIAKNFIRLTGGTAAKLKLDKPVYATLAISREALLDKNELLDFLTDVTLLDDPPDGFYVLVAAGSADARSEIFHADVIAGWLLVNHVLSLNGYTVVNGYSDLLTPLLGVAGAAAGATGWWSNLQTFSLGRFLPAEGGRLPVPRYLSKLLLNRITFFELHQLREPYADVLNGLDTDTLYAPGHGSEPRRAEEVLQSWEAIRSLIQDLAAQDVKAGLELCRQAIEQANAAYDEVARIIPRLDAKSNREHLDAMSEGLRVFEQLAEL